MSCDWHIRCLDCNDDHEPELNHGDDLMRSIIANAKEIGGLSALANDVTRSGWFLELSIGQVHIWPGWFAQHAGHRLAAVNEYGDIDGECNEKVMCKGCGTEHRCRLPHGHAGEHDPRQK